MLCPSYFTISFGIIFLLTLLHSCPKVANSTTTQIPQPLCIALASNLNKHDLNLAFVPDNNIGKLISRALFACSIDVWMIKTIVYSKDSGIWVRNVESSLSNFSLSDGIYNVQSALDALLKQDCRSTLTPRILAIINPLGSEETLITLLDGVVSSNRIVSYINIYNPLMLRTARMVAANSMTCQYTVKEIKTNLITSQSFPTEIAHTPTTCAKRTPMQSFQPTRVLDMLLYSISRLPEDFACQLIALDQSMAYMDRFMQILNLHSDISYMALAVIIQRFKLQLQVVPLNGRERLKILTHVSITLNSSVHAIDDNLHGVSCLRLLCELLVELDEILGTTTDTTALLQHSNEVMFSRMILTGTRRPCDMLGLVQNQFRLMSTPLSIMSPSIYLFIRCKASEKHAIISYLHNHIILALVRSTSDHIAWLLLDIPESSQEEMSFPAMLESHHEDIKVYAESYVSKEDLTVFVPSYAALLRLNIHTLQHQPVDRTDVLGDSSITIRAGVMLEPPVNLSMRDVSIVEARSAVVFGSILFSIMAWIYQQGGYYFSPATAVTSFFSVFELEPFWDFENLYWEQRKGFEFYHMLSNPVSKQYEYTDDVSSLDSVPFLTAMEHLLISDTVSLYATLELVVDVDMFVSNFMTSSLPDRLSSTGDDFMCARYVSWRRDLDAYSLGKIPITQLFIEGVLLWLGCGDIYVFALVNILPRAIFTRLHTVRLSLSPPKRLEELTSLIVIIKHLVHTAADEKVSILFPSLSNSKLLYFKQGSDSRANFRIFTRKIQELASIALYIIGDVQLMKVTILDTVIPRTPPAEFNWASQKNKYQYWSSNRTHFIAVATENSSTLKNLYEMAAYADLDMSIIGLGRTDFSWQHKLIWVKEHLESRKTTDSLCIEELDMHIICADDVVVIIDAYDIALTMAARLLARSLFSSETPMVFCGEVAAYPNPAYAYVYPTQEGPSNHFLNGGCFLAPVEYVVTTIDTILIENSIRRSTGEMVAVLADDQYEWARHMLERPYLIRVEYAQETMMCVFRTSLSVNFTWSGGLAVTKMSEPDDKRLHRAKYPAIVHFNADIKVKYAHLIDGFYIPALRRVRHVLAPTCIRALYMLWDDTIKVHAENISSLTFPPYLSTALGSVPEGCMRPMHNGEVEYATAACKAFMECSAEGYSRD